MKLVAVVLDGFRSYRSPVRIELDELTAFVGKNDVGKSTVLEALEIFFNGDIVRIEPEDSCVHTDSEELRIGCVFTELPEQLVIDERAPTSLADEYLLNQAGELEIHQVYDCSLKNPKPKFFAKASHPTADKYADLLNLTITKLRARATELGVDLDETDKRVSSAIRRAIWSSADALNLEDSDVPLDSAESKRIWNNLRRELPVFALFQSDRPSRDQDPEVQDPMKLAVKHALQGLQDQLDEIKEQVRRRAVVVAERTLAKLQEMDSELAERLIPDFSSEPKWDRLFKLTLEGDDGIPVNKRGSGVRRLILLNFFRAEAERRRDEQEASGIIYAIEEPETSQHPQNQRALIDALIQLSQNSGVQIILTTHVPALAGMLPIESLRYVSEANDGSRNVLAGTSAVFRQVAESLGVLPDPRGRVSVLVYVEGPNDIAFLHEICEIIASEDDDICSLRSDERIALIPTGGSSLKAWVQGQYLNGLGLPEVHLYDRDDPDNPPYQPQVDVINARSDGSYASLTDKRELENYLDRHSIIEAYAEDGIDLTLDPIDDWDSVPEIVAEAVHEQGSPNPWNRLDGEKRGKKVSQAKRVLSAKASQKMTTQRLRERRGFEELRSWLEEVGARCG